MKKLKSYINLLIWLCWILALISYISGAPQAAQLYISFSIAFMIYLALDWQ
jgi:hypothetical protein